MTNNIALIVLDTVRKDVFDDVTREIGNSADVNVTECIAPSSWTVPSHASMFTGNLPHSHGVHAHNPDFSSIDAEDTFLSDIPHRKVGVSGNGFLSPAFNFDAWFDEFWHLHGNEELIPGGVDIADFAEKSDKSGFRRYTDFLREAYRTREVTPSLVNALYSQVNNALIGTQIPRIGDYGTASLCRKAVAASEGEEPFFLFMNSVEAHSPHENRFGEQTTVPNKWSSRETHVWEVNNASDGEFETYIEHYRKLYRSSVEYLGKKVSKLIKNIKKSTDNDTTFIITSDHGEHLGLDNRGRIGHKGMNHQLLHVPLLILNGPSLESNRVSLLDLPKIVNSIADGETPSITRELYPTERIGDIDPPDDRREYWNRGIRFVYHGNKRYKWDTQGRELCWDVTQQEPIDDTSSIPIEVTDIYSTPLSEYKKEVSEREQISAIDEARGRLEDLGYLE